MQSRVECNEMFESNMEETIFNTNDLLNICNNLLQTKEYVNLNDFENEIGVIFNIDDDLKYINLRCIINSLNIYTELQNENINYKTFNELVGKCSAEVEMENFTSFEKMETWEIILLVIAIIIVILVIYYNRNNIKNIFKN
jgi:hypothetical protein